MNKHGGYIGKNIEMIDFSVNINPLGIPETIKKKLIDGIDELVKYPEITGRSALIKISQDLGVFPENVILGNGAIELIYLFSRSNGPGKALIIQPTFNEYERALKLYGWDVDYYVLKEENDFSIDPVELEQVIEKTKPQAVFLCNPNNPTGRVYSIEFITKLIEKSAQAITWFLDESFMDFANESGGLTLVKDTDYPIFILKSLTKFYALPGLRIGYGVGNPAVIKKMESFKEPWTINGLGLIAATAVYDEIDYAKQTKAYIEQERQRIYEELKKIETIKVYQSGTDFHLCRLLKATASELKSAIESEDMSIRTCEDFVGLDESYFRIAIKKSEENNRLLTFIKDWRA
ncbi:pyridoxal phosphate-dependent aminotransferase [Acetobacterium tundrae]|uniref:Aminotransferase n=1 Tax=Acetobacterium tundrae TaxID=132932 RepID=A0ABR6WHJ1_9FIRM|nr:aminotransferase class I/II-fold pyridoxal phosphate-dependent enzyme [Acetobacterium tundrae]MBC3795939.1 aminotransferase class I/II-fold pyridoxal phosphate-dependent enzyme [Acetobacterium tundrae]